MSFRSLYEFSRVYKTSFLEFKVEVIPKEEDYWNFDTKVDTIGLIIAFPFS